MLFITLITALLAITPVFAANKVAVSYSQCKGSTKKIALTFDDGPYLYETQLRDVLRQYGAKATFFVNGKNYACAYDESRVTGMKNLFNDGHEFGSHSWSHPHFPPLTWDQTHDQMWKVELLLNRTLGVYPALFRAPYGEYQQSLSAIGTRNQSHIYWTFDSGDSLSHTEAQIKADYQALINKGTNNVIALNHSPLNITVSKIMPWLLPKLKAAGYKMVTISECLGIPAYQSKHAAGVRDSNWHC